ncbi:MAG: pyridoxamine 5'-phosphate oxidase family protein [Dehalococcoidia bacterium]
MPLTSRLTAPHLDPSYGVTKAAPDASWPAIEEKLAGSRNYWICTTRAGGAPHSKPVWGVWSNGLWFSTGVRAVTGRNLARDARVSVHTESGDDVVILEGEVAPRPQSEVPDDVLASYAEKYGFDPREHEDPGGVWFLLVPSVAHTWLEQDFQNSVGRWEFDEPGRLDV